MAYKRKRFDWAGGLYAGRRLFTRRRFNGPGEPSRTNVNMGTGPMISNAIALGRSRSRTMTTTKNSSTSGVGVTQQHDMRRVYTKRRMPNYKKKPWKRFVKKVHAVAEKDMGSRTVLFNDAVSFGNGTAGNHTCCTLALYSLQSTNSWLSDLSQIATLENVGNPTAVEGATVYNTTKYLFQSGILDLTIRNGTYKNSGGIGTFAPEAIMELDVYELYATKDFVQSGAVYTQLSTAFNEGFNITDSIDGVSPGISIQQRGATPFECGAGISRFGIKITKKTKYFIPGGGTVTYQLRDPKRHVIMGRDMAIEQGVNMPKFTKFVYLIGKVIPGFDVGGGADQFVERIQVGATRKYLYKIEGLSDSRDRYINNSSSGINPN